MSDETIRCNCSCTTNWSCCDEVKSTAKYSAIGAVAGFALSALSVGLTAWLWAGQKGIAKVVESKEVGNGVFLITLVSGAVAPVLGLICRRFQD